nr:allatostatin-A receptor-like [Lytechinus pictus]
MADAISFEHGQNSSSTVEGVTLTSERADVKDVFFNCTMTTEGYHASALVTATGGISTIAMDREEAMFPTRIERNLSTESDMDHIKLSCDSWEWNALRWGIFDCIQVLIGVFGIIGNLLVIVVLAQRRGALHSMDIMVGALAIADLVSSVFIIPVPTSKRIPRTPLGLFFCKMIDSRYFLFHGLRTSSYILMAMGAERYMAVAHPLNHMVVFTSRRSKIAIMLLWLAGILSALFIPFVFVITPQCTCLYRAVPSVVFPIGIFNYLVTVVLPISTLLLTQGLTAYSLHKQRTIAKRAQIQKTDKPTFHIVARNRVIKLMLIVVSTYIICFTPNMTAYFLVNLGVLPITFIWSPLSSSLILLMFLNSCANPIIYTIRYPPFRKALKGLFCGTSGSPRSGAPLFGHNSESVKSTTANESVSKVKGIKA